MARERGSIFDDPSRGLPQNFQNQGSLFVGSHHAPSVSTKSTPRTEASPRQATNNEEKSLDKSPKRFQGKSGAPWKKKKPQEVVTSQLGELVDAEPTQENHPLLSNVATSSEEKGSLSETLSAPCVVKQTLMSPKGTPTSSPRQARSSPAHQLRHGDAKTASRKASGDTENNDAQVPVAANQTMPSANTPNGGPARKRVAAKKWVRPKRARVSTKQAITSTNSTGATESFFSDHEDQNPLQGQLPVPALSVGKPKELQETEKDGAEDTDAVDPTDAGQQPAPIGIRRQSVAKSNNSDIEGSPSPIGKQIPGSQSSSSNGKQPNQKLAVSGAGAVDVISVSPRVSQQLLKPVPSGITVGEDIQTETAAPFAPWMTIMRVKNRLISNQRQERQGSKSRPSSRASVRYGAKEQLSKQMDSMDWIDLYARPVAKAFHQMTLLKMFCIFGAIFFPDLWVLLQIPNQLILDIVLTLIFFVFAFDFVITCLTDASYVFSLFSVMDALSSLSMITDISYLLGRSGDEVVDNAASSSDAILRLARVGRLVTRVGRLTRTSKALWIFLGEVEKRNQSNMLRVMGNQLRTTLSLRLSWIMFCCVFVSPTTLLFIYPIADESLLSWAEILSKETQRYYAAVTETEKQGNGSTITSSLGVFHDFYAGKDYGPVEVYFRDSDNSDWLEASALKNVSWSHKSATKRKGSCWRVETTFFQAIYDMSVPDRVEAAGNIGLIVSVVIALMSFSVTLHQAVTVLALNPLERMLAVVRWNCAKIFQYAADIEVQLDPANAKKEKFDMNEATNESDLLEAVIDKLAIVCERAVAQLEPAKKVAETEEDHLIMYFQDAGRNGHSDVKAMLMTMSVKARQQRRGSLLTKWQGTQGVPLEVLPYLDTANFCPLDMATEALGPTAYCLMVSSNGCGEYIKGEVGHWQLTEFLQAVQGSYPDNPFTTFRHALDVLACVSRLMTKARAMKFLSETQQFVVLIAALAHDIGHLGVNNMYLTKVSHELALEYNDLSPMENMHCATLFNIVSQPAKNIFANIQKANSGTYKTMRKELIESIMATDVSKLQGFLEKTELFYQLNHWEMEKGTMTSAVKEMLSKESQTFQSLFLIVADNSYAGKPWELAQRYGHLTVEEAFIQGDLEQNSKVPIQPLCNRKRVCKCSFQLGWTELVVLPMTETVVKIFPSLDFIAENLCGNFENWIKVLKHEQRITKDDATRLAERAEKIGTRCEALKSNRSWTSLPDDDSGS